jgi:hypothetical protein
VMAVQFEVIDLSFNRRNETSKYLNRPDVLISSAADLAPSMRYRSVSHMKPTPPLLLIGKKVKKTLQSGNSPRGPTNTRSPHIFMVMHEEARDSAPHLSHVSCQTSYS